MTYDYWERETRDTFNIIEKYAPPEGITRTEIDSFSYHRQKQTRRDTTVLVAHGKIKNVSKNATPRYIVAEPKDKFCPRCEPWAFEIQRFEDYAALGNEYLSGHGER